MFCATVPMGAAHQTRNSVFAACFRMSYAILPKVQNRQMLSSHRRYSSAKNPVWEVVCEPLVGESRGINISAHTGPRLMPFCAERKRASAGSPYGRIYLSRVRSSQTTSRANCLAIEHEKHTKIHKRHTCNGVKAIITAKNHCGGARE